MHGNSRNHSSSPSPSPAPPPVGGQPWYESCCTARGEHLHHPVHPVHHGFTTGTTTAQHQHTRRSKDNTRILLEAALRSNLPSAPQEVLECMALFEEHLDTTPDPRGTLRCIKRQHCLQGTRTHHAFAVSSCPSQDGTQQPSREVPASRPTSNSLGSLFTPNIIPRGEYNRSFLHPLCTWAFEHHVQTGIDFTCRQGGISRLWRTLR